MSYLAALFFTFFFSTIQKHIILLLISWAWQVICFISCLDCSNAILCSFNSTWWCNRIKTNLKACLCNNWKMLKACSSNLVYSGWFNYFEYLKIKINIQTEYYDDNFQISIVLFIIIDLERLRYNILIITLLSTN